jgi:mono/diheme cytochrome c family protein
MMQAIWDRLARWQPGFSPRIYKAALVGLLLAAVAVPLILVGLPFIEFLNGMAAQPKAKTQMAYGRVFDQELPVDRMPVHGTLPRDYVPVELFGAGNTVEEAKAAGAKLHNPIPLTIENIRRGQNRYETFCISCHGPGAEGNGGATGPNRFPAPPSLHTDQARGYTDGTLFYIITRGVGKMPPYADKLSPEDRWKVVQYVRALQLSMNPPASASRPVGVPAQGERK